MFVPVILGSDKTTVSVGTGNNEYWPVYLSIGNIHNNVRRAHRNGVVLLGFLAIPKSVYLILHFSLLMPTSGSQQKVLQ
jgi:Plavaka transposase